MSRPKARSLERQWYLESYDLIKGTMTLAYGLTPTQNMRRARGKKYRQRAKVVKLSEQVLQIIRGEYLRGAREALQRVRRALDGQI